jgi:hypothetical protein
MMDEMTVNNMIKARAINRELVQVAEMEKGEKDEAIR